MNKKFIAVICAALIICLSIPSVPVLADSVGINGIVTNDSVSGFDFDLPLDTWSGGVEGDGYALSHFVSPSDAFPYSNQMLTDRGVFDQLAKITSVLDLNLDDYYYALGGNYGPNLGSMTLFLISKDQAYINDTLCGCYQTYNGSTTGSGSNSFGFCMSGNDVPSDVTSIPITLYNCSWTGGTNWSNWTSTASTMGRASVDNQNSIFYYYFASQGQCYNLMYSNIDFFFLSYGTWKSGYKNDQTGNWVFSTVNQSVFCNKHFGLVDEYPKGSTGWFNLLEAPYYNGSEIIIPDTGSGEESNINHMYFRSCDFGFCEPLNVSNYSRFGGSYIYVDYGLDSWVLDHISDYQIEFHAVANVSGETYSATVHYAVDPDGVLTIPFSIFDNWSRSHPSFSSYVTNQRIDQSFLKTYLYSISGASYRNFYDSLNSESDLEDLDNAINDLVGHDINAVRGVLVYTDGGFSRVITENTLTTEFISSLVYYRNFTISLSVKLIDNSGNESGIVSREFDLVRGSSISTDNSGLTNYDPFIDESDDYLPTVPDNNTLTPSGSNNNYIQNNLNVPSNYTVTYRDGVNDFIDWFNEDPEVTGIQDSFWGAMGVFKGNPANELYSDYFGFLPDGFKSIIFGCAGIGIIGGAATVLRKRLMK